MRPCVCKNGKDASVTMHVIEGRNEREIRNQLMQSLDAFFEFYPELVMRAHGRYSQPYLLRC